MGSKCSKRGCPGEGLLGRQAGALRSTSSDPLINCLQDTTYNLGGAAGTHTNIEAAMEAFISQTYPRLGQPAALTVVPDLPGPETGRSTADRVRSIYSTMGCHGGLLEGEQKNVLSDPKLDSEKKKIIQEMQKKYGGEKGEAEVLTAVLNVMAENEGLVMLGHKTALSLVEDIFKKELENKDISREEKEMEVVEKLFSYIGVTPEKASMQKETEQNLLQYTNNIGIQSVEDVELTILKAKTKKDKNKHDKNRREKAIETLQKALDENKASNFPKTFIDPVQPFLLAKMKTELNKMKREHDITVVRPELKTVAQIEETC